VTGPDVHCTAASHCCTHPSSELSFINSAVHCGHTWVIIHGWCYKYMFGEPVARVISSSAATWAVWFMVYVFLALIFVGAPRAGTDPPAPTVFTAQQSSIIRWSTGHVMKDPKQLWQQQHCKVWYVCIISGFAMFFLQQFQQRMLSFRASVAGIACSENVLAFYKIPDYSNTTKLVLDCWHAHLRLFQLCHTIVGWVCAGQRWSVQLFHVLLHSLPHLHALLFVSKCICIACATLLVLYNGDHRRFLRIKLLINKLLARWSPCSRFAWCVSL